MNDVRRHRYADAFARGPVRPELPFGAFLYEPRYELLRQQMLAAAIEADLASGFDRVTLAHVSPVGNAALKAVTSPALRDAYAGGDACSDWSRLLTQPDRHLPIVLEALIDSFPIGDFPALADWHACIVARYSVAP